MAETIRSPRLGRALSSFMQRRSSSRRGALRSLSNSLTTPASAHFPFALALLSTQSCAAGPGIVALGRPGATEAVLEGMKADGEAGRPDPGFFLFDDMAVTVSSTQARALLKAGDREGLVGVLDARVAEWCLKRGM